MIKEILNNEKFFTVFWQVNEFCVGHIVNLNNAISPKKPAIISIRVYL